MKIKLLSAAAAILLLTSTILPNGLSLNSIGARPFGMGGAFVGLANDYTAIYWNPAGLALLEGNYIGIFGTDIIPVSTYKTVSGMDISSNTNHYISPNLMTYFSFKPMADMTIGLGAYVPAGIGAEWKGSDFGTPSIDYMSKIAVINISPVISYRFSENFQMGAALNIYYGMFDLKRAHPVPNAGVFQYSEESNGLGFGTTIGGLYKISEMISIGASFRTKSTVDMSGTAENAAFGLMGAPTESDFDREVAWPMWIAGGLAVRPIDNLTLTFDAQFSQWSKSENELVTRFSEPSWVQATTPNDGNKFILKWKDATQLRFGAEYTLSQQVTVRGGYYNDPAPAPDDTYNILFPSITYNAITVGGSFKLSSFTFDAGFEYLIGQEREISGVTHCADITAFTIGIGYGF